MHHWLWRRTTSARLQHQIASAGGHNPSEEQVADAARPQMVTVKAIQSWVRMHPG